VPVPLQVRDGVNVEPVQLAATQVVPVAYRRQAPAPLQNPSVPQVEAPWSLHWFSGSCPAATLVHAPSEPASAHDWQVPVHAVWQHTPCWQKPERQSLLTEHVEPAGFFVHAPATQTLGARQSASAVQAVRQTLLPQT
jgi:hypothetical protein